MASYTRQTYSLAVVMLETTQTINFFIPIMLVVFVAVGVAGAFNRSIYERALRSKQIPMLRNHCPKNQKHITAFQLMSSPVTTVEGIISVEYLQEILQHEYSSFPVMNSAGFMVGIIPKNFIITLIKHHHFYNEQTLNEQQKAKLPKMYRNVSSADELMQELNYMHEGDEDQMPRRAVPMIKPTLTQNDWFMREFDKEEVKDYHSLLKKK